MTNSVPVSESAVKVGWWILAILVPLGVLFFVAVANGWISIPVSSAQTHRRGSGPIPWLLMGAIVLLVVLVDAALIVWIVRRRRAKQQNQPR
jgi:heme/copper-type cytochrome/quinol oxidase subunit 2